MLDALKSNPDITAQLISQNRNHMNPNNQMVNNIQPMTNNHGMNQINNHPMNPMQMNSKFKFRLPSRNFATWFYNFSDNLVIFFYRDGSNAYEYESTCQADWNAAAESAAEYAESMEYANHEE